MKVTLINASARENGSCSYILDRIKETLHSNNVIKYDISKMNINYCLGCKRCYIDGKCVQNDDVKMIVENILTSDFIFIATPSYWADVPGQLKTFFDRNTPFGDTNNNRILKANKNIKGIGIAVRAGKSEKENEVILDFIDHYYGHLEITPIKRFSIREVDSLNDLLKKRECVTDICSFANNMQSHFEKYNSSVTFEANK